MWLGERPEIPTDWDSAKEVSKAPLRIRARSNRPQERAGFADLAPGKDTERIGMLRHSNWRGIRTALANSFSDKAQGVEFRPRASSSTGRYRGMCHRPARNR